MKCFSEKVYLEITPPTEEDTKSDQHRICQTLSDVGYKNAKIPLHILQKLYPLCRECDYHITVTLVYREKDWIVTDVEAGDTRQMHYGLAVDYGSTTIVMQLSDHDRLRQHDHDSFSAKAECMDRIFLSLRAGHYRARMVMGKRTGT